MENRGGLYIVAEFHGYGMIPAQNLETANTGNHGAVGLHTVDNGSNEEDFTRLELF